MAERSSPGGGGFLLFDDLIASSTWTGAESGESVAVGGLLESSPTVVVQLSPDSGSSAATDANHIAFNPASCREGRPRFRGTSHSGTFGRDSSAFFPLLFLEPGFLPLLKAVEAGVAVLASPVLPSSRPGLGCSAAPPPSVSDYFMPSPAYVHGF